MRRAGAVIAVLFLLSVITTSAASASDGQTHQRANEPPRITTNDTMTAREFERYNVTYTAIDNDTGDVLTWSLATNASDWLTIDATSGLLEGTPVGTDVGHYWVNVTVRDKSGAKDYHNFTLTVLNVNDPPVITSTALTEAWVDVPYQYDVMITDPDSTTLYVKLDLTIVSMWIIPTTHSIYWVPNDAQVGEHTVIFNASDGKEFTLQEFKVMVRKNHAPVIGSEPLLNATVGIEYVYRPNATDEDGDELSFSLADAPPGMAIDEATGNITWTPTEARAGLNYVRLAVKDWRLSAFQEFNISVTRPNSAPVITSGPPNATLRVGEQYRFKVVAMDSDQGDTPTYALDGAPAGMSMDPATGNIAWTTTEADQGRNDIRLKVSDGRGGEAHQDFSIAVVMSYEPQPKDTGPKGTPSNMSYILLALLIAALAILVMAARRP